MEGLCVHAFLFFATDSKSSFGHAGMVLNFSLIVLVVVEVTDVIPDVIPSVT